MFILSAEYSLFFLSFAVNYVSFCSHGQCLMAFFETLYNFNKYTAVQCASYKNYQDGQCDCETKAVMGYATPSKYVNLFFLKE